MRLSYVDKTDRYVLMVDRHDRPSAAELVADYGMDMSSVRSTSATAILYTDNPYTAAPFHTHGDEHVKNKLKWITDAVAESWKATSTANIACPADRELWGFQKASIEYILRRGGGLVADEPGLGKTPIAICLANEIKAKRVLVVCPASIRLQWASRVREWSLMRWPYIVYPIIKGARGVHPTAEWTIVSYDLARTEPIGRALARGTYDLIILDEAHMLKTVDAIRTRAVFGDLQSGDFRKFNKETQEHDFVFKSLASRAGMVVALTGTPLLNRPREAYTLARNLCWDSIEWQSEDAFTSRFNPRLKMQGQRKDGSTFIYVDERTGRHQELQYRMRANFMVRHLKREVMPQLKLPIYDLIRVHSTGAVKQALHAESLLGIDPKQFNPQDIKVLGHIAAVRRMMGIAIAPQVCDWVDMLIDGGEEKLVVFGWHIEVLNMLERSFSKHGCVRIDGSTPTPVRQTRVNQFINDPLTKIIFGNMQSMGIGTDGLQQVACHALIAEPDWVPGNNIQAVDRLDRGGQQRTVQADIFVAPGSVVEKILASALDKAQNIHRALDKQI